MSASDTPVDSVATSCVVVGGGPAGVVLTLLLARQSVPTTLLESHKDFDRDFRGDTIHPSTLEMLDTLGLADDLHKLPHGRIERAGAITPHGTIRVADLSGLRTKFPYIMTMPQAKFLDFLAERLRQLPAANLVMGAMVNRLVEADGGVHGVCYRGADGKEHEVRAPLTVAADGRFSKVRSLAGFTPKKTSPPMDVLWFRLPKAPGDPHSEALGYIGRGRMAILLDRGDEWQVGYVYPKGEFAKIKAEGIEILREHVAEEVPFLANRVNHIRTWGDCSVLSVESSRLAKWYKPGLLLIGDAAHAMSPVGGVGINYAIYDAVETANRLADPLKRGTVTVADLVKVQNRRMPPTRVIQAIQGMAQRNVIAAALSGKGEFHVPFPMRVVSRMPMLQRLTGRMLAFGILRPRVKL